MSRLILLLLALLTWSAAPALAEGRVSATNPDGDATVDPTYATTLTVRGTGFQAVEGGHGGVYVFFGHVGEGWRPSQGGRTGEDYFYVPDSESRDNQGFQQFVAFPGSDTASSAQATMTRDGTWTVQLTVPGAVFEAFDRSGGSRTLDCREVTCGVITVGAHGVTNANNESFTPLRVEDLYGGEAPAAPTATATPDSTTAPAPGRAGRPSVRVPVRTRGGAPTLEVDRASAAAGRVLPFTAAGLVPMRQYSLVLDDGVAGAGPFVAGPDGSLGGVLTLPADLGSGTHVLRLWAGEEQDAPEVAFAVRADDAVPAAAAEPVGSRDPAALAATGIGALLLALALLRLVLVSRGRDA